MAAPRVIILIAPYFDEESVVFCLSELRKQGVSVLLMGVTSGLICSERGLMLRPDTSLLAVDKLVSVRRQALVISGGETCATAVLSDPRSHRLMERILQTDGYVAALSGADGLVWEAVRPEWLSRFVGQGGMETAVFAQRLIQLTATHP